MSALKRIILLAFFSQLFACGQKGALVLPETPAEQPITSATTNETSQ